MVLNLSGLNKACGDIAAKKPEQKPVTKQPLQETIIQAQKHVETPVKTAVPERASPDKKEAVQDKKTGSDPVETGEDTKTFSLDVINKVLNAVVPKEVKEAKPPEDGNIAISMNVQDGSVMLPDEIDSKDIPGGDTTMKAIGTFFNKPSEPEKVQPPNKEPKAVPSGGKKDSLIGVPVGMDKSTILNEAPGGDTAAKHMDVFFKLDADDTNPVVASPDLKDALAKQPEKGTAFPETDNTSTIPPTTARTQKKKIFDEVIPGLNDAPQETDDYTQDNIQSSQAPQEQTPPQTRTKPYKVQLDMGGQGANTDLENGYWLVRGAKSTFSIFSQDSSGVIHTLPFKNGETCKVNNKRIPFKLEVTVKWHRVPATEQEEAHAVIDKAEALVIPRTPNKAWERTKKHAFGLTLGAFTAATALVTNVFVPEVKQTVDASGMPEFLKSTLYPVLIPLAMIAFMVWSFVERNVHKKEAKKV